MKSLLTILVAVIFVLSSCKTEKTDKKEIKSIKEVANFDSFGDKISSNNVITHEEMLAKFEKMNIGDTINIKFSSTVDKVCPKKGCWMKLPLGKETETMVRFKDYGFFMPLDSKGREVIVEGKAFVKVTSVKELQHYAEDAGKSAEEIAKITEPKKEYAFEANGVLMKIEKENSLQ